jgi:hypothetical protein
MRVSRYSALRSVSSTGKKSHQPPGAIGEGSALPRIIDVKVLRNYSVAHVNHVSAFGKYIGSCQPYAFRTTIELPTDTDTLDGGNFIREARTLWTRLTLQQILYRVCERSGQT